MPVNRVKQVPKSKFIGNQTNELENLPEYSYTMQLLQRGLNGEVLEITLDPKDLASEELSHLKHPHAAFVHLIQSRIKAAGLHYAVRQRQQETGKPPRIYVVAVEDVVPDKVAKFSK